METFALHLAVLVDHVDVAEPLVTRFRKLPAALACSFDIAVFVVLVLFMKEHSQRLRKVENEFLSKDLSPRSEGRRS